MQTLMAAVLAAALIPAAPAAAQSLYKDLATDKECVTETASKQSMDSMGRLTFSATFTNICDIDFMLKVVYFMTDPNYQGRHTEVPLNRNSSVTVTCSMTPAVPSQSCSGFDGWRVRKPGQTY